MFSRKQGDRNYIISYAGKKLRDNRGSLLIISYLVIFVLLALGAAFIAMSVNESRIAERQRRTTLTLHIAEAGIERAFYDLRQDFLNDASSPSWADGDINGMALGPNTASFYTITYGAGSTSLNGGSYAVQLKNVSGISGCHLGPFHRDPRRCPADH